MLSSDWLLKNGLCILLELRGDIIDRALEGEGVLTPGLVEDLLGLAGHCFFMCLSNHDMHGFYKAQPK